MRGGAQTKLSASCTSLKSGGGTYVFPLAPLAIRRGPDGFVYVLSAPYSGPSYYNDSGIFRMDPATGVATIWSTSKLVSGFAFSPRGSLRASGCIEVSRACAGNFIGGPSGPFYTGAAGPLALVPAGVTPARGRSWGSLKSAYR